MLLLSVEDLFFGGQDYFLKQKPFKLKPKPFKLKPGLHELQLPVERNVTLVSSIVVDRRRCALQVSSVARLQENKEK